MQKLHRLFILFLTALLAASFVYATPKQTAFDLVQETTDRVFSSITKNRETFKANDQLFYKEIDEILSPVVDFERIARRVMAKYYKQASSAQREEFVKVFKQSLLKLYAKGLLELDNEKVIILPPSRGAGSDSSKQIVDVEVITDKGEKYPITYSMFLNGSDKWKMENVIVNGINIGLTYRNQFSHLMETKGNDIDQVIAGWTSKVVTE